MAVRRRRYARLTGLAERAIAAHREARIAEQLSTEPADRERVERGIAACYRFIALEPPQHIVWIDSPAALLAGPIAAAIMAYWERGEFAPGNGSIRGAIERCVRPYVGRSVPETVVELVRQAVLSGIGSSTRRESNDVDRSFADASCAMQLRNACGNLVTDGVRLAMGVRLYRRLHDALDRNRENAGAFGFRAVEMALRDAKGHAQRGNGLPRPLDFNPSIERTWNDVLHGRTGGPHEGNPCLTSFVRDVVGATKLSLNVEFWQRSRAFDDMQSGGPLWPHRAFCIVSHPPVELHVEVVANERGERTWRLHNTAGPAIVWRDGTAQWYVHDVYIDSAPASAGPVQLRLTADRITATPNVEERRVLVEFYGRNRYLREAGATRIDVEWPPPGSEWAPPHDVRYRALWRLNQRGDEPLVVVDVINQTPEPIGTVADGEAYVAIGGRVWRRYMLRVPPTMTNCAEAVAWTCGKTAASYAPRVES